MAKFQLNDMAEEVQKEYQKKVEMALKRAEKTIQKRMIDIIQKYMIKDYYEGYDPQEYERTYQLPLSVAPYTEIGYKMGAYGISFGIEDEDENEKPLYLRMSHTTLKMNVTYKQKKTGKTVTRHYEYQLKPSEEREERIYNNFLQGYHPNVGQANSSHIESEVNKALDDFFDNELQDIVLKELAKIK